MEKKAFILNLFLLLSVLYSLQSCLPVLNGMLITVSTFASFNKHLLQGLVYDLPRNSPTHLHSILKLALEKEKLAMEKEKLALEIRFLRDQLD